MTTPTSPATSAPQSRGDAFVKAVLETTLTQLSEVGFQRLSIPQIADSAGVNKTSIYRRWPAKLDLVADALRAAMSHVEQVPDTGNLRDDLFELARTAAAFMSSPVGAAVVGIIVGTGANPELRALATAAYSEPSSMGPWLVMKRAIDRGELAADSDVSLLLFTIAGAIIHRVFVEQQNPSHDFLNRVVNLVLNGVAAKR